MTETKLGGDSSTLKQRILFEATKLFAQQGYNATSIRQVVEACDCTKPALYYYFSSKENLFEQIIQHEVDLVTDLLNNFVTLPGPIRPRIHDAIQSFVEHMKANRNGMNLLQRVDLLPEDGAPTIDVSAGRKLHFDLLADLIEQGIRSGEVRKEVDPFQCAFAMTAICTFHLQMWQRGEIDSLDDLESYINLLFDGVSGQSSPPPTLQAGSTTG